MTPRLTRRMSAAYGAVDELITIHPLWQHSAPATGWIAAATFDRRRCRSPIPILSQRLTGFKAPDARNLLSRVRDCHPAHGLSRAAQDALGLLRRGRSWRCQHAAAKRSIILPRAPSSWPAHFAKFQITILMSAFDL